MGLLSQKVARLRKDIQQARIATSGIRTAKLNDTIAGLLLTALSDEYHPLCVELVQLRSLAETPEYKSHLKLLFMPQPGVSLDIARFWPLQLLMLTAAKSAKHSPLLADHLMIFLGTLRQAVNDAIKTSVKFWSNEQYLSFLLEAINSLEYPDPPIPIKVAGRVVQHRDGNSLRTSPQEANMLRTLLDCAGQWVTLKQFNLAGINHPKQVKNRLISKCAKVGIHLPIESTVGSYRLPEQWD